MYEKSELTSQCDLPAVKHDRQRDAGIVECLSLHVNHFQWYVDRMQRKMMCEKSDLTSSCDLITYSATWTDCTE